MLALVIIDTVVVLLLAVLVAGLLRSHADILRALHQLGAGVGDPASPAAGDDGGAAAPGVAAPLHIGPPLPGERDNVSAPDISGVTPSGNARAIRLSGVAHPTLLAFLSSGCATCAGIWRELSDPAASGLPAEVRVVAVTKGPEFELSGEVSRLSPPGLLVVMSTEAWGDYEVPGSPFFVLVDGPAGRRLGEGVASRLAQVADLVRRARAEAGGERPPHGTGRDGGQNTRGRALAVGLDGKARESQNDRDLAAAGVLPGDRSLYPSRLDDLFGPGGPPGEAAGRRATAPEVERH